MTATKVTGPLLVLVGETASGKSALALELAERLNGEVICADSRTVYRGMDIGTAKPSAEEQKRVRHFCLDLVMPDQQFTVADFKRHAMEAIDDITSRGKLPILVGGTGLYIDAILYDYQFRAPADTKLRAELNALSVPELQQRLIEQGVAMPNNSQNPRHLVRALETAGVKGGRQPLRENTLVVGLAMERDELRGRIEARVEAMVRAGLENEVKRLSEKYGWDTPPMQTIGYQEWKEYFSGIQTREQTKQLIISSTFAYAKRQRTWFKRNNSVQRFYNREKLPEIVELTTTLLNK
jgi:tRNA dimethylallyltransferase